MARLTLSEQIKLLQSEIEIARVQIGTLQSERGQLIEQRNNLLMAVENQHKELSKQHIAIEDLEKVKKDLESSRSLQNHYSANAAKVEGELEQCHAVLDGVAGAPAREYEGEYGKRQRTVATRLAGAFLSIAKNGGAK